MIERCSACAFLLAPTAATQAAAADPGPRFGVCGCVLAVAMFHACLSTAGHCPAAVLRSGIPPVVGASLADYLSEGIAAVVSASFLAGYPSDPSS